MTNQLRELDHTEIEHVGGGKCTCGVGKNCVTKTAHTSALGATYYTSYNCSGTLVGSSQQP